MAVWGPTSSDVHVDQILSNISIQYKNSLYIGDQILPMVEVGKQSDKYYLFTKGDWFRNEATKRAPGGESEGGGFRVSTDSYYCEEVAFHTLLPDEVRDNSDSVLSVESQKTNFVTEKIVLSKEVVAANLINTAGNWGGTAVPANKWSDFDLSDPIADMIAAINVIESTTGQKVNTAVMGYEVWLKLKQHPQLLDRLPVTGLRMATLQILQELIEVQNIMVGRSLINTANEGQADSFSYIWGKNMWFGVVPNAPARETPAAGYCFCWPRDGKLRGVRRWRDEDRHSDKIEAYENYGFKVTGKDLGYLLTAVVA